MHYMVYDVWCMIRTQIYLPEDLKLQLRAYAEKENVPVSEMIRRSLRRLVSQKVKLNAGRMLLKLAARAGRGPRDLSRNFFDYAYGKKSGYAK